MRKLTLNKIIENIDLNRKNVNENLAKERQTFPRTKSEKVRDRDEVIALTEVAKASIEKAKEVGGKYGYEVFLKIITDDNDPSYEQLIAWGKMQGYTEFDIEMVNLSLKNKRLYRVKWFIPFYFNMTTLLPLHYISCFCPTN